MRSFLLFTLALSCICLESVSQPADTHAEIKPWDAEWITVPNEAPTSYGVYLFRRSATFSEVPATLNVHVSADNRYKLYINGKLVSLGPARGDQYYWNYETVDIAPYLKTGQNIITAIVWNESDFRPEGQISLRTGFILQADGEQANLLNTGRRWRCLRDSSHKPLPGVGFDTYYVAGPGEIVDMNKAAGDWMSESFDDSKWQNALRIDNGNPKGIANATGWMLVPSSLPQMERTQQRIPLLRQATGITVPTGFPAFTVLLTVPPHTIATLLLDQTFLTNAFITMNFGGGKNAGIGISYAEALFSYNGKHRFKDNRDNIAGKTFQGRTDSVLSNGSTNQTFTTLTWRTFRYIQIRIRTGDEALQINDFYGTFTGYPFKLNAKIQTADTDIRNILTIGWRTARLCAAETYMDCPYYEQLQYIGDSRIQAMISYYNSGDDRLARNAITQMDHSRLAEGITLSRHPSYTPQIISTFTLWYIAMLHDYWMYRADTTFVKGKLPGTRAILNFFEKYQQPDGSLKNVPYWAFTDWIDSKGWDFGVAPKGASGSSAILDMQLLMAYQMAAAMESREGMRAYADKYRLQASKLKLTIQRKYWNSAKKLYGDTEEQNLYSQHTNAMAVLTGLIHGADATALCKHMISDTALTKATIYFKYYVHQALIKGGLGDDYMSWLGDWRNDIKIGLTTWAEISDIANNRSDCHAWGASPNIEFFRTVLGIDSDSPGFKRVRIEPHLGKLTSASGEIPHPAGKIAVNYLEKGGRWLFQVKLPTGITGSFVWKNKSSPLRSGQNSLNL